MKFTNADSLFNYWNHFVLDVSNREIFSQSVASFKKNAKPEYPKTDFIDLPGADDNFYQETNILRLLESRKSSREWTKQIINLQQLSNLLNFAIYQKITQHFSYSSAGGLYTVQTFFIANGISGLSDGLYFYDSFSHAVKLIKVFKFIEKQLNLLGLFFEDTPKLTFLFLSDFQEVERKYLHRALRFVLIETGEIIQNLQLLTQAMKLNHCAWGSGFDHDIVASVGGHIDRKIFTGCLIVG